MPLAVVKQGERSVRTKYYLIPQQTKSAQESLFCEAECYSD